MLTWAATVQKLFFFQILLNWVTRLSIFNLLTRGNLTYQACPQSKILIMLWGHLNNNIGYVSSWMTSFTKLAPHSFCLDHDKSILPVSLSLSFFFFFFLLFRATPAACGGFQDRGWIAVCDLHHSSLRQWILNPLSKARDWTGIFMDPSQVR